VKDKKLKLNMMLKKVVVEVAELDVAVTKRMLG
jgi:hypothetical protein